MEYFVIKDILHTFAQNLNNMSERYIKLQNNKLKVPLLAGDGTWDIVINSVTYSIDIFMEALFSSLIYDGDKDSTKEIMHYIIERYDKKATPVQIENFITLFKGYHKAIPATDAELSDITLLGNDEQGCCIPIYKYVCAITKSDEKAWVDEINANPRGVWMELYMKIFNHIQKYDQCYYPKWGGQNEAEYILNSFLRVHGLPVRLSEQPLPTEQEKRKYNKEITGVVMFFCVFVFAMTCDAHTGDSFKGVLAWSSIVVFGLCVLRLIHLFSLSNAWYQAFLRTKVCNVLKNIIIIALGLFVIWFYIWANNKPLLHDKSIFNKITESTPSWLWP